MSEIERLSDEQLADLRQRLNHAWGTSIAVSLVEGEKLLATARRERQLSIEVQHLRAALLPPEHVDRLLAIEEAARALVEAAGSPYRYAPCERALTAALAIPKEDK